MSTMAVKPKYEEGFVFLFGIVWQAWWYVRRARLFALMDDGMASQESHLSL